MRIKFLKADALATLKANLSTMSELFYEPTNESLIGKIGSEMFLDSKIELRDGIILEKSALRPHETDRENTKRLYQSIANISETEATDERLWAGMCIYHFWDYVKYRWPINPGDSETRIRDHFCFGMNARRSLTRNALARLWWIGRWTYDETLKDPYELTDFVCRASDYIFHVFERNTSNNRLILQGFAKGVRLAERDGCIVNTDRIGELSIYLNRLGGIYILDCLPPDVIAEKIRARAKEICT